jgi:hypothetical protein
MQILRLLADTPRTTERLREIMPGTAKAHVNRCVERLRMDGLIALKWGKWHLSKAGRRGIPAPAPVVQMRPYQPPVRPPRRAGSDHSHLPSVAGGQLVSGRRLA